MKNLWWARGITPCYGVLRKRLVSACVSKINASSYVIQCVLFAKFTFNCNRLRAMSRKMDDFNFVAQLCKNPAQVNMWRK